MWRALRDVKSVHPVWEHLKDTPLTGDSFSSVDSSIIASLRVRVFIFVSLVWLVMFRWLWCCACGVGVSVQLMLPR